MLRWGAIAVAVMIAAAPGMAQAQGVSIPFEAGQYRLTAETRAFLDGLTREIAEVGEVAITGHADVGEAAAAAEIVAALRARTIAGLLSGDDLDARLGLRDDFFAENSHELTPEGVRRLDETIARRTEDGGYLVFVHPDYGADALERRRADALAEALFSRGAIWIKADGDDFPPGESVASAALRAEAEALKPTITQPAVVVQALDTNLAEGSAALGTLGFLRARVVRDYLTAGGVPAGLLRVGTAGADQPAGAAEANRRVEIVAAPSGW